MTFLDETHCHIILQCLLIGTCVLKPVSTTTVSASTNQQATRSPAPASSSQTMSAQAAFNLDMSWL